MVGDRRGGSREWGAVDVRSGTGCALGLRVSCLIQVIFDSHAKEVVRNEIVR